MAVTDYTLKQYTTKKGLLPSYFFFKNVQEVSFHDSSMNVFDKEGMLYVKILKVL